jgi:hypothetical protein
LTELPEWEVTSDPPTVVTADSPQQAADERVRLELESPADEDPDPRLFVRLAGSDEPWQRVYPNFPPLTVDEI